jgi:hypothetical protein
MIPAPFPPIALRAEPETKEHNFFYKSKRFHKDEIPPFL